MTIGEYEVVRTVAKGGMSEVYEVRNQRLGSRHALKLFSCDKDIPGIKSRFLEEGKILAGLNHPRVVGVTDFGVDDASGRPYVVMRLVEDENGAVRSLADAGCVDEETVGRWYDDMREGLAYIHAQGIVHRDLKLGNVLVGPDGHAVLIDFGISKCGKKPEEAGKGSVVDTLVKIRDGQRLAMGSVGYMAPEFDLGLSASEKTDYYALGVIVYRLLTGMWCDARTDLRRGLDGYDPVWQKILPLLLHANPEGRAALSYGEEKRVAAEKEAVEAERGASRLKFLMRMACAGAGVALALVVVLAAILQKERQDMARLKAENENCVNELQKNLDAAESKAEDLESVQSEMENEIEGLKTDLKSAEEEKESLEKDLEDSESRERKLEERLENVEEALGESKSRVKDLEDKLLERGAK